MTHTLILPIRNPQSAVRNRTAFTLTELLVVLAIIVLLLAAAVPAFNLITGSRSADAAENLVSAMLARARATAIENRGVAGVAFFVNPADRRASMALVVEKTNSTQPQEDPYPEYRGWTASSTQSGGTVAAPKYLPGQQATSAVFDNVYKKYVVSSFTNIDPSSTGTAASAGNAPPPRTAAPPTVWANTYWSADTAGNTRNLDFYSEGATGIEALPAGVAVQLINDPKSQSARDRYVQTGVILFDAQGRLISVPYAFKKTSDIFNLLKIPATTYSQWPVAPPVTTPATPAFYSQLGLVIYDRANFLNQPGDTEGDSSLLVKGIPSLSSGTWAAEQNEENWLDQNTTPLFVNRNDGTLLKGQ